MIGGSTRDHRHSQGTDHGEAGVGIAQGKRRGCRDDGSRVVASSGCDGDRRSSVGHIDCCTAGRVNHRIPWQRPRGWDGESRLAGNPAICISLGRLRETKMGYLRGEIWNGRLRHPRDVPRAIWGISHRQNRTPAVDELLDDGRQHLSFPRQPEKRVRMRPPYQARLAALAGEDHWARGEE